MSNPSLDASTTGGFFPGGRRFAVDGDWTFWGPHGPPEITFPIKEDSIFSNRDIVLLQPGGDNWLAQTYTRILEGTAPNLQPFFPAQHTIMIRQKFRGSFDSFQPMRLNTQYNAAWAEPWLGTIGGVPNRALTDAFLVEEVDWKDLGSGGACEIERVFVTLPPTRNTFEQFNYNFIGFADNPSSGAGANRNRFTQTVQSRIQYDYFVFDDLDLLAGLIPLFNGKGGNRLDATTGASPTGLILDAQKYYDGSAAYSTTDTLNDQTPTIPSFSDYVGFLLSAEIVAEASTLRPWKGNIYERATRFVLAL